MGTFLSSDRRKLLFGVMFIEAWGMESGFIARGFTGVRVFILRGVKLVSSFFLF